MPISKELLDILACPVCKVAVNMTADGKGLKCNTCKRIYPIIKDDIPVMLPDEATIDDSSNA
ncbi:Trm112 family protein [Acidobacteriota bacterium]